ncbi:MAG: hypothetical protein V1838_01800 [Patescibacteria group bacterium]
MKGPIKIGNSAGFWGIFHAFAADKICGYGIRENSVTYKHYSDSGTAVSGNNIVFGC